MKLIYFLILFIVVGNVSCSNSTWKLVWSDEFTGNQLNESEWVYETRCKWGNREEECYTAHRRENVRVENGHLVIEARPEAFEGQKFTSGKVHTKVAWAFGKIEARVRLPSGKQLWPAFWMMPKVSKYGIWAGSGEIDIFEVKGDHPNVVSGTIHYGGTSPNNTSHGSGEKRFSSDFSADFHIFTLEWEMKEMRWYIDGHHYHTENLNRSLWSGRGKNPYTKNGQPFDQPFYVIFNTAVGGNFFGKKVPSVTPEEAKHWKKPTMEVDYLRVYQK